MTKDKSYSSAHIHERRALYMLTSPSSVEEPGQVRLAVENLDTTQIIGTTLSQRDVRELAFELLQEQFDVNYEPDGDARKITLTKKVPPVEVGQYYLVTSQPGMAPEWQNNPLAKVTKSDGRMFLLETEAGHTGTWTYSQVEAGVLTGPLKVESRWTVVED